MDVSPARSKVVVQGQERLGLGLKCPELTPDYRLISVMGRQSTRIATRSSSFLGSRTWRLIRKLLAHAFIANKLTVIRRTLHAFLLSVLSHTPGIGRMLGAKEDRTTHWKNNTNRNWWNDPGLRKITAWIVLLYCGSFTIGYDGSLLNGLQALPQWNKAFNNPSGARLGLINASLSLTVVPWICDTYGRKKAILLGSCGVITGALVGALAKTEAMFITGRVIVGVSCIFTSTGTACLINELVHPRLRGICGSLYLSVFMIGGTLAAWLSYGTLAWDSSSWQWRLPVLFQVSAPLILLLVASFGPESPRYLISKGRHEEALAILAKYHANGETEDELVQNEFKEIKNHIVKELEGNYAGSWKSLFKTRGNRRRVLITERPFYTATLVNDAKVNYLPVSVLVNGLISIFGTFFAIVGGLCVNKIGRRMLYLLSNVGLMMIFAVLTALAAAFAEHPGSSGIGISFVVMLFLALGIHSFGWLPLGTLYPAEILPYSVRSKGLSLNFVVLAVSLSVSGFVNPIGLKALQVG
ncbi:hypothetical protein D9757_008658 [Collybiopsis confluens]|uniref:Major facilitator superfamily (MFS) profile domain-containing protein n=1 Tax=Collybiopsis confluens TaxID=2823264 RepID=A0A8H5H415_9AGAR|nr:hypothetical protein D9757_008658 [Collybiopsis confluens]